MQRLVPAAPCALRHFKVAPFVENEPDHRQMRFGSHFVLFWPVLQVTFWVINHAHWRLNSLFFTVHFAGIVEKQNIT